MGKYSSLRKLLLSYLRGSRPSPDRLMANRS